MNHIPQEIENPPADSQTRVSGQPEASVEELLRGAVHDLRGPLNQLQALTELLSAQHKDRLGDDGETLCTFIQAAAKRGAVVVNALEAYADMLRPVVWQCVDMNSLLQSVMAEFSSIIQQRNATVHCGTLCDVQGEREKLAWLVRELLENALKFNSSPKPEVRISATRQAGIAQFSIADNGIGIAADRAERIFAPFKRLNGFEYEGAGMGLAIASKIVNNHGGRIWVEPTERDGAEFRFTLPAPD